MEKDKKNRKKITGTVVSTKMNKTVVVLSNRFIKHPKYGKYIKRSKRYKAHDETDAHKVGEVITIEECRPISKDKHFRVL